MAERVLEIASAFIQDVPERGIIDVLGHDIPTKFHVIFFFKSLASLENVYWSADIEIEINKNGFVDALSVRVLGDAWRVYRNKFWPIPPSQRRKEGFEYVDSVRLKLISSLESLHRLKALSVGVAFQSFELADKNVGEWSRRKRNTYLSEKDVKQIEKEFLSRKSYVERGERHLEKVRDLYNQAKADGMNPNQYIAKAIGEEEHAEIPLDTVTKWVRRCRDQKMLPPSNYGKLTQDKNSSPSKMGKAVPDNRKQPTKKKGSTNVK